MNVHAWSQSQPARSERYYLLPASSVQVFALNELIYRRS
jgi:hypothetical protein